MADRADVLRRFMKDTAEHQLTVLRDEGLYRHLRFRKPGTGCYGFDIVTWPGYLAICGDMGESVFTRSPDMIEFFRSDAKGIADPGELFINPGYWSEKCKANDAERKEFCRDRLDRLVLQHVQDYLADFYDEEECSAGPEWAVALWEELQEAIRYVETTTDAIHQLDIFKPDDPRYDEFRFHDAWEYASSLEAYTFHFLWRLYAISHAVLAYDSMRAARVAEPVLEVDIP